tara:strand:- start:2906 stop:3106 length:201 start_codon:yes stop_codon:yes gene_type:complete
MSVCINYSVLSLSLSLLALRALERREEEVLAAHKLKRLESRVLVLSEGALEDATGRGLELLGGTEG